MSTAIRILLTSTLYLLLFSSCGWAQGPNSKPDSLSIKSQPESPIQEPQNIPIPTAQYSDISNNNTLATTQISEIAINNTDSNANKVNYIEPEVYDLIWIELNPPNSLKKYHVYNCNDSGKVYRPNANPNNCMFVISKREFRIYVYEVVQDETLLVAHFPVCLARNPQLADKTRSGDGTTPHCAKDRNGNYIPFTISQIAQSSTWRHDFGDGRGNILAYGDYFMRLQLNGHRCSSNRSIGIHGSTNNEFSVPGLDSEGCIRLRNKDLLELRKFAKVGTKVIIKPKEALKLPFEREAQEKCDGRYERSK